MYKTKGTKISEDGDFLKEEEQYMDECINFNHLQVYLDAESNEMLRNT